MITGCLFSNYVIAVLLYLCYGVFFWLLMWAVLRTEHFKHLILIISVFTVTYLGIGTMIKNVKKKGKETHIYRHCWSRKSPVKRWNIRSFQSTLAFISYKCRLTKVLAGAARGKGDVRMGKAEWGYRMLISGNCQDLRTSCYAISNWRRTWSGAASRSLCFTSKRIPFFPLAAPANTLVSLHL